MRTLWAAMLAKHPELAGAKTRNRSAKAYRKYLQAETLSPNSQEYRETRADEIQRAKKRREFKQHAEAIGRGETPVRDPWAGGGSHAGSTPAHGQDVSSASEPAA
jgi:hypothetical protein